MGKLERASSKRTISTGGGLGLLQMVSEPDTGRCASEETEPQRGWTRGGVRARTPGPEGGWIGRSHTDWRRKRVPARTLGPEGGWSVRSYIDWGGERNILYKGVETSP